jgi:leucyl aminopeptidase
MLEARTEDPPSFEYSDALPLHVQADLLVIPTFRGSPPEPGTQDLGLDDAYALANLTGEEGEDLLLVRRPGESFRAGAVLLVGLGEPERVNLDAIRRGAQRAGAKARRFGTVATTLPQACPGAPELAVRATIEGFSTGIYRFAAYRTTDGASDGRTPERIALLGRPEWAEPEIRMAVDAAAAWAKTLVDTPAAELTPARLAERASEMAGRHGLGLRVLDEVDLAEGGFGGILGVGAASAHPPRLIELRYRPPTGVAGTSIALTGKGVTFDAGGLALKKLSEMVGMKSDMAGAAAVLAAMRAIAELAPPDVEVLAAIPTAENMPGGSALRPGDVLRHRNGRCTEVVDPDAEGRLLLADALAYLAESRPAALVDAATLTYSCIAALGDQITAAMGNDRAVMDAILRAGEAVGEPMWELPLWQRYRTQLGSGIADSRNEGEEGVAGAIVAGLFLEPFVSGIPWVHLDIGGSGYRDEPSEPLPAGATGVPTRTLVRFVTEYGLERRAEGGS